MRSTAATPFSSGSSPHTRGALAECHGPDSKVGIIPAYAGSTPSRAGRPRHRRDHPRIRGEHSDRVFLRRLSEGSSPHTRGARGRYRRLVWGLRIIPAYAGSTCRGGGSASCRGDHPRIRGEHASATASSCKSPGSSPHTRGAPTMAALVVAAVRIIPAYAGSTFDKLFLCGPGTDHPRIRGEHLCRKARARRQKGSSPHTRGARRRRRTTETSRRIIPAYAGSTLYRHGPYRGT